MAYVNTDTSSGMSDVKFWALAAFLLLVWGVGLANSYTMGGTIHLFLIAALGMVTVRKLSAR